MRYDGGLEFSHNLTAQITEKGADGSEVIVKAEYQDWGAGPGPDKAFGTADDDLTRYIRVARDSTGKLQGVTYSESPGPDLQWFTADDVVVPVARISREGDKEVWTLAYPNLKDASMILLDDVLNPPLLRRPEMNPTFQAYLDTATRKLASFGNDFGYRWDLPDRSYGYPEVGEIDSVYVKNATPDGFEIRAVLFVGPDKIGGTGDDVLGQNWRLNRSGSTYSIINFGKTGTDQIWGTADDDVTYAKHFELDPSGDRMVEKSSISAGADNIRFTDDDAYSPVIERRTWQVGTRKFLSIQSAFPSGSSSGPTGGQTEGGETSLYIFDSAFLPGLWTGPREVYRALKLTPDYPIQHLFVRSQSAGDVADFGFSYDYSACVPDDMVTLAPCVGSPEELTVSTSYSDSVTVRRISADAIRSDLKSPYRGDATFGASSVRVDRLVQ